ncbi:DNA gyrase inhibitor YacG [Parasphingopyxis algicola]|uniref:DNA gyrase inhibitor YacG n=1 Tax=Parasphingopyxis algicola TaxID=2026624 RepID=UPI0015A42C4E|nr:DNA gyrase inhibitor YacG [Parasphingopyxis algicola]QLC25348.1 DNA gyrase inhibitor YacG [Parasphingopyxis algicola]
MPGANRSKSCPVCGAQPSAEHKPFCSDGCRDRDLLQWLGDGYRVPGPPADPELLARRTNGLDSDS